MCIHIPILNEATTTTTSVYIYIEDAKIVKYQVIWESRRNSPPLSTRKVFNISRDQKPCSYRKIQFYQHVFNE
ncbi:hypothetical protein DERF_010638 [Dermatophagoides farinae]|uniref:Uncharacterized protein n=1 Tax=Dermatophagoides farinae TaxID=6954 RepID=A0A922L0V7_DERFA|nr:hypothetical protein DERF_010638 [Dermatophagoides farinae]